MLTIDDRYEQAMETAAQLHQHNKRVTVDDVVEQIYQEHGFVEDRELVASLDLVDDPITVKVVYTAKSILSIHLNKDWEIVEVKSRSARVTVGEHNSLIVRYEDTILVIQEEDYKYDMMILGEEDIEIYELLEGAKVDVKQ